MKPWEFGRMTPGEYLAMARGHLEARKEELRLVLMGAWQTAALVRCRRLPSLKSYLAKLDDPKDRGRKKKPRVWDPWRVAAAAKARGLSGPWDEGGE